MGVEGALAETKGALVVAQAVGGDAELGVLEAGVEAGVAHLVSVDGVVVCELREGVNQVVEVGLRVVVVVVAVGGVLVATCLVAVAVAVVVARRSVIARGASAVEREGHHRDGPSAKTDGGEGLTLGVQIGDQTRGDVPVTLQVQILEGVHGCVLKMVE